MSNDASRLKQFNRLQYQSIKTTMSESNKLQSQSNEKVANEAGAPSTEKKAEGEKKKLPQLGALEDDDEFEVCSISFPFWVMLTIRIFQQLVCQRSHRRTDESKRGQ